MAKTVHRTPRAPRTALYEKVVPAVLLALALILLAVIAILVVWPVPGAG